jgi:hypothetical protein
VQQFVLIVDGLPDAAEAAAAEIRQTVAVGRVSEGLAPPNSARLSSGVSRRCRLAATFIACFHVHFASGPVELDQPEADGVSDML